MRFFKACACVLAAAAAGCGGGGSAAAPAAGGSTLTAQELVESCVTDDLSELSALLAALQGFLGDGTGPQPEFDLVAGVLTGRVPWTIDLDGDGADDLGGLVYFTDPQGALTIPVADLGALLSGDPDALAAALAAIPVGTTFHLEFATEDAAAARDGEGELLFLFGEDGALTATGSGAFTAGECGFDFTFEEVDLEDLDGTGFPVASLGFDLTSGERTVGGSIDLDGTATARVEARLDGGEPEFFDLDLEALAPPAID